MSLKEHEYIPPDAGTLYQLPLDEFCDHILITNFRRYLMRFQEKTKGRFPRETSGSSTPKTSTAP